MQLELIKKYGPYVTLLALVALWEGICRAFQVPAFVLPTPSGIVEAAFDLSIKQWAHNFMATLEIVLIGYLVSIAISIPLGVALTASRFLANTFYPLLVIIQSTPIVSVAPVIVVMLGTNMVPRVVITFLITFFPIVIATATGLRATPDEFIELSRSLRASKLREYTQIRLPYAVPYIFSALKISMTLAIVGAVVAEFVAAEQGLGFLILYSTAHFKIPQAFSALAFLIATSLVLYQAIVWIERIVFPWSIPARERQ